MKITYNETPVYRPFKTGDIIQDKTNTNYMYLLGTEKENGKFDYVIFNTKEKTFKHNFYGPYNFNEGSRHKLLEGRLILEND